MSLMLMEALQLLKFALKKQRLDFTKGWGTLEADMVRAPTQPEGPEQTDDLLGTLVQTESNPDNMDNILNRLSTYN